MYTDSKYVYSGLITGTMWDAIMQFVTTDSEGYSDLKNTTWGNFTDTTLNNIHGQYIAVNSINGNTSQSENAKNRNNSRYGILTTASTEDVKKKNLYDLAGNILEWIEEACWYSNTAVRYINRGGCFADTSSSTPVCYRGNAEATNAYTNRGFRPALFIK